MKWVRQNQLKLKKKKKLTSCEILCTTKSSIPLLNAVRFVDLFSRARVCAPRNRRRTFSPIRRVLAEERTKPVQIKRRNRFSPSQTVKEWNPFEFNKENIRFSYFFFLAAARFLRSFIIFRWLSPIFSIVCPLLPCAQFPLFLISIGRARRTGIRRKKNTHAHTRGHTNKRRRRKKYFTNYCARCLWKKKK